MWRNCPTEVSQNKTLKTKTVHAVFFYFEDNRFYTFMYHGSCVLLKQMFLLLLVFSCFLYVTSDPSVMSLADMTLPLLLH